MIQYYTEVQEKGHQDVEGSREKAFTALADILSDYFDAIIFFADNAYSIGGNRVEEMRQKFISIIEQRLNLLVACSSLD